MKIKPDHNRGGVLVEPGPDKTLFPADPSLMLFRLKRMLVPVDFSDCSKKALQYAVPLARQFGAEIVLVHVVQPYVPVPEMTEVDWELIAAQMRRGGERELGRLRESILDDIRVRTVVRMGRPDLEIVKAADDLGADLILLSTHGRTGLGRVFLGSVAEHVIRFAHCPVLTVRERERDFVEAAVARKQEQSAQKSTAASNLAPVL